MKLIAFICTIAVLSIAAQGQVVKTNSVKLGGLFDFTGGLAFIGPTLEAAARLSVEDINNSTTILNNTRILWLVNDTQTLPQGGLRATLYLYDQQVVGLVGAAASSVSKVVQVAAQIFQLPQISYASTNPELSNKQVYPYFLRVVPSDTFQGIALVDMFLHFGWDSRIAVIATNDAYGLGVAEVFINEAGRRGVEITTYQTFPFAGSAESVVKVLKAIKDSNAKIIITFMIPGDAYTMFSEAYKLGMGYPDSDYVWVGSDGVVLEGSFTDPNGTVRQDLLNAFAGLIGTNPRGGVGPLYDAFLDKWASLNSTIYPGAGTRSISFYGPFAYDAVTTFALAIDKCLVAKNLTGSNLLDQLKQTDFQGITGRVTFDENGDRKSAYEVVNLRADQGFVSVGVIDNGQVNVSGIIFPGGSTEIPVVSVFKETRYYQCENDEFKTFRPKSKNDTYELKDDEILDSYYCDDFVDCENMADEGLDCATSYVGAMIAIGVLTGIMMLGCLFLAVFVFVYRTHRRIMASSPLFLYFILLGGLISYSTIFTWFARPNNASCFLRPWLLAVGTTLMGGSLFIKTVRIYKIYQSSKSFKTTVIPDRTLVILVGIALAPTLILLVLWSGITPQFAEDRDDANDSSKTHKMCYSDNGVVFFALLLAYFGGMLVFGSFMAWKTRKVAVDFKESRQIGFSIYNLTFISIIMVAIYFVIRNQPLLVFCFISGGILVGVTSTLFLVFVPKIISIVSNRSATQSSSSSRTESGTTNTTTSTSHEDL